jgi:cytochrome c-type biogenesis protein
VLPLVPPYLCYLAGITFDQLVGEERPDPSVAQRVFFAALAFVLGFAVVFVAMGASASLIGQWLAEHADLPAKIAGVPLIAFGLHFLGVFRLSFLMREARLELEKPRGLVGSFLVGMAFAFGWTPCVGPVLAAILFVAGSEESVWEGASLLAAYAAGLALPFLAAALAVRPFLRFTARFRPHLGRIEMVMGGLLVLTGLLFITDAMDSLGFWILDRFPALARLG